MNVASIANGMSVNIVIILFSASSIYKQRQVSNCEQNEYDKDKQ